MKSYLLVPFLLAGCATPSPTQHPSTVLQPVRVLRNCDVEALKAYPIKMVTIRPKAVVCKLTDRVRCTEVIPVNSERDVNETERGQYEAECLRLRDN